jgi:hypothetical protein
VVYCIRLLLDNTIYSGHTCSRHTPGARTPLCRPRPTSPQRSAHHFLVVEHGQWSTSAVGDGEKRDCRTDRSPRHCGARASQTMYVKKKFSRKEDKQIHFHTHNNLQISPRTNFEIPSPLPVLLTLITLPPRRLPRLNCPPASYPTPSDRLLHRPREKGQRLDKARGQHLQR